MPSLHCLCLPIPISPILKNGVFNLTAQSPPNLSAKTSSFNPPDTLDQHSPDLPLRLPDLTSDAREKILSLEIMGVDSSRALALHPDLRYASPDSIHSVISFLLSKGIHHKDLGRIFGMCPRVLTSSVGNDLLPVFNFLSRDLKVADSDIRHVIKKCPRFLVSNVRDQLRPTLIYLQSSQALNLESPEDGQLTPENNIHTKDNPADIFTKDSIIEKLQSCSVYVNLSA